MNITVEKNILVQCEGGEWFSIPPSMKDEFTKIKERTINADVGSDEWGDANDELDQVFGTYRKD